MILDISHFFDVDDTTYKDKGIVVYTFKDDLLDDFVSGFVLPFRQAYVSDEELNDGINNNVLSNKEEGVKMLLPTKPSLKSGEFAEILLYYISQCFRCPDINIAPLKWRWKENQDMPCHLTDIVLAKCEDEKNPTKEDYLYFVESKAAAIPLRKTSKASVFNVGIKGAVNDSVSRIGKTITYLITKYNKEKEYDKARKIKRFSDSVDTVEYQRYSNAAIVVDSKSLKKHIDNITIDNLNKAKKNNISLFAIPITEMKSLYNRIYDEALKV